MANRDRVMKVNIDGFLMDNKAWLSRIISGRDKVILIECRNGIESWFEIHEKTFDNRKNIVILETTDTDKAKQIFIDRIK